MKKLDKLIADMENLTTQDDTGFSYIADEDAKDVIHYLKEYREKDNPPLTWSELKQMEGKPVFLEQYWYPMEDETGVTEDEVETDKYWAVIDNVQAKRIHFVGKKLIMGMTKSDLDPNKNGGWQAYRKERE